MSLAFWGVVGAWVVMAIALLCSLRANHKLLRTNRRLIEQLDKSTVTIRELTQALQVRLLAIALRDALRKHDEANHETH